MGSMFYKLYATHPREKLVCTLKINNPRKLDHDFEYHRNLDGYEISLLIKAINDAKSFNKLMIDIETGKQATLDDYVSV